MSDTNEQLTDIRISIKQTFVLCEIYDKVPCAVLDILLTSDPIVMTQMTASFCNEMMVPIRCAAMCCDLPATAPTFHTERKKEERENKMTFETHVN